MPHYDTLSNKTKAPQHLRVMAVLTGRVAPWARFHPSDLWDPPRKNLRKLILTHTTTLSPRESTETLVLRALETQVFVLLALLELLEVLGPLCLASASDALEGIRLLGHRREPRHIRLRDFANCVSHPWQVKFGFRREHSSSRSWIRLRSPEGLYYRFACVCRSADAPPGDYRSRRRLRSGFRIGSRADGCNCYPARCQPAPS